MLGKIFGLLNTSNRVCLLWNCFRNYVYLKDMYITLEAIGKTLFVSVLRILLTCKSLNFTAAFTKKIMFPKFAFVYIIPWFNIPYEKVNFSLIHQTCITIHRSSQLSVKVTFKTNSKNSDYWIFLISKSSPIYMSCSRTQTGSYWNTCPEF